MGRKDSAIDIIVYIHYCEFMQSLNRNPVQDDFEAASLAAASDEAARLLRAMAHGPRLRILCTVLFQELPSGEIARAVGLREPATSQQLALLRAEKLVDARRVGQKVLYSVSNPLVRRILEELHASFCPAIGT